jgi:hypothetical protein
MKNTKATTKAAIKTKEKRRLDKTRQDTTAITQDKTRKYNTTQQYKNKNKTKTRQGRD